MRSQGCPYFQRMSLFGEVPKYSGMVEKIYFRIFYLGISKYQQYIM